MIEFTKLNGDVILINLFQIESVEIIPDSKIIMMNGKFHIVKENKEEIMKRILQYRKLVVKNTDAE